MSAFRCSDLHTAVIAQYGARQFGIDPLRLARDLRRLNNYALTCRYGEPPKGFGSDDSLYAAPMETRARAALEHGARYLEGLNPADIAAAVSCFEYQCSEGDADTRAEWKTLQRICAAANSAAAGLPKSNIWSI